MSLPRGHYYIGDLSYVLTKKKMEEIHNITFQTIYQEGVFRLASGTFFAQFCMPYGDKTFSDNEGRLYITDSDIIGCIPVQELVALPDYKGHVICFDNAFSPLKTASSLEFGPIRIFTSSS